jgi:hypothetical protein
MGTNLSQVFVSDALSALSGTTFNSSGDAADDVGVWKLDATAGYMSTALFQASFDTEAEVAADDSAALTTVNNPLWLVNDIQIVQRASPNFIASPLISTRNIKSIKYQNHTGSTMHAGTVTFASDDAGDDCNVKIIVRSIPTDYLNFGNENTAIADFSNEGYRFPVSVSRAGQLLNIGATGSDASAAGDDLVANIEGNAVLNAMLNVSNSSGTVTLTARHPGFIFDLYAYNNTDSTEPAVSNGTAKFDAGVGNDWQVVGDEMRCRSRYGNFNRMYFPQAQTTFGQNGSAYDKLVIEYAHNWPSSTGIAPAGELNQAVIYFTNAGTDPGTTGSEFATLFGFTDGTDIEYRW